MIKCFFHLFCKYYYIYICYPVFYEIYLNNRFNCKIIKPIITVNESLEGLYVKNI